MAAKRPAHRVHRAPRPIGALRLAAALSLAALSLTAACGQRNGGGSNPTASAGPSGASAQPSGAPSPGPSADACAALTPQQRATVVARVGETSLTLCDFARRINLQNQYLRARFTAPEQRRALLRAWVDSELLASEARARGLDREPSVHHAVTAALARQLESDIRGGVESPSATPDEVSRYYEEHRAEYDTPEQVRASQIVLASREAADRVLEQARAHAADDEFWRALARRESADAATRDSGGDLGFFSRDEGTMVAPEVAAAAFALARPGDVAPAVVESAHGGPGHGRGFHVVRFTARRDALHRTLDEVRRSIEGRITHQRAEEAQDAAVRSLVERLRRESQVSVDEAALAQVHIEPAPGVAPAMTGPMPWLSPTSRGIVPAAGAVPPGAQPGPPAPAVTAAPSAR